MVKTLRIRNKQIETELTLWKLFPTLFMILLMILSAGVLGGAGTSGGAPPRGY